jgi:FkbM family methyltransferase
VTSGTRTVVELDPNGFNELRMCRSGPMIYNKNDIYVGGSLRKYGEYSISEQEIFGQIVGPGMLVVEVGANIGGHTVQLARAVGHEGEVHAFEPQRIVFQTLCANLALNQITNVYARQMAVGAAAGEAVVPASDPSVRRNFGGISLGGKVGEVVPLVTLDGFDLPACHMLKADVEGMEADVLLGASTTIERYRPVMYLENDRRERSPELLTLVGRLDYSAYWHLAPLFNAKNFAGDPEDIFNNVFSANILCIPKESKLVVRGLRPVASAMDW